MILLKLFWSFMLIGFGSFGGLSMIPQISNEVLSRGWMTAEQVTDIVAIAEMTPGPLGLNCASFAGMQAAGIPGAIAANLGVLMPSITLCAIAAVFFHKFRNSRVMQWILVGVRPTCLGMVVGVVLSLSVSNYWNGSAPNLTGIAIGAIDLYLLMKRGVGIPKVLIFSAAAGLVLHGALGLPA